MVASMSEGVGPRTSCESQLEKTTSLAEDRSFVVVLSRLLSADFWPVDLDSGNKDRSSRDRFNRMSLGSQPKFRKRLSAEYVMQWSWPGYNSPGRLCLNRKRYRQEASARNHLTGMCRPESRKRANKGRSLVQTPVLRNYGFGAAAGGVQRKP